MVSGEGAHQPSRPGSPNGGLVRGNILDFSGNFRGAVKYDSIWPDQHFSKKTKRKLQLRKSCFCWGVGAAQFETHPAVFLLVGLGTSEVLNSHLSFQ